MEEKLNDNIENTGEEVEYISDDEYTTAIMKIK
jgi:hypothetical protein